VWGRACGDAPEGVGIAGLRSFVWDEELILGLQRSARAARERVPERFCGGLEGLGLRGGFRGRVGFERILSDASVGVVVFKGVWHGGYSSGNTSCAKTAPNRQFLHMKP
jgi:hypothetical protein